MKKQTLALIGIAAVLLLLAGAFCGAAAADNPVNEEELRAAIADSGQSTVTLGADITLTTGTLTISRTVTLDLNGKILARSSAEATPKFSVITIEFGGNLTLTDSSSQGTGKITGGSAEDGGGVCVNGGTFTMEGGSITRNTAGSGGGVCVNGGTFTMEGGSITRNTAGSGGGVYIFSGSTFTMSGGSITGNIATFDGGGGVYIFSGGTFTMEGGSITGNTVTGDGGGVYVFPGSTFTMSGGSITGNGTLLGGGGGVYVMPYSTFIVSGTPVINGNTKNGAANNVYLRASEMISPPVPTFITLTAPLTGGEIHITTVESIPLIPGNQFGTTTLSAGSGEEHFIADTADSLMGRIVNGKLVWGKIVAQIGTAEYFTVQDAVAAIQEGSVSGTICMVADTTENIVVSGTITLDLNGHVLNGTGNGPVIRITSTGKLTVMDSNPTAVHRFSGSLPGKLTWDSTETTGSVEIEGGCITGGKGYDGGGGVYNEGTFTMNGGNIVGNSAHYGGGVYNEGTFTMNGGESVGNSATYGGGGVYVRMGGMFTMKNNASISGNYQHGYNQDGGGGVFVGLGGTFTMEDNSSISGNAAEFFGGGVFVGWRSTFTMTGSSSISGNCADRGGGGVCMEGDTFTMSENASITKNSATSRYSYGYGGGVCVNTGDFTLSGTASISENTAEINGGGVYILGAASYTMTGGEITGNSAGGNGGGLYFAGTSYSMTGGEITKNSAAGDGGGVYYNGGGTHLKLTGGKPVINGNTKSDGTTANNLWVTNPAHIHLETPLLSGTDIRVTSPTPYPGGEFGDSQSWFYSGAEFIKSDDGGLCGRINDVANLVWDDTEEEVVDFKAALVSNALLTASSNETGDLTATLSPDKMVESVTLKGVDTSKAYKLNYKASSQLWESEIPKMTGSELLLKPFKLEITCDGEPYPDANLTIKFKVNPEKVKESGVKAVRLGHLIDIIDNTWEKLDVERLPDKGDDLLHFSVTAREPTRYFVVAAVKSAPKKSSSSQGTSIWLTETPTPTPTATPTVTPTPAPTQEAPTVKPIATETPTPASPAPFIAIIAGLGAAAVVALRRR